MDSQGIHGLTTDPVVYLRNPMGGEGERTDCNPNTHKGMVFGGLARLGWARMRDLGELDCHVENLCAKLDQLNRLNRSNYSGGGLAQLGRPVRAIHPGWPGHAGKHRFRYSSQGPTLWILGV